MPRSPQKDQKEALEGFGHFTKVTETQAESSCSRKWPSDQTRAYSVKGETNKCLGRGGPRAGGAIEFEEELLLENFISW